MTRGWLKNGIHGFNDLKKEPQDNIYYHISSDVIRFTEIILLEYACMSPSNEGFVYWAGKKESNAILINTVIAPKTESSWGGVVVSYESNLDFVLCLSSNKLMHIGQVHSHPGKWVGHSSGDDAMAPYKSEGLLSLVVSHYGVRGLMPLYKCGIHRYDNSWFVRLSEKYINARFKIEDNVEGNIFDLRF